MLQLGKLILGFFTGGGVQGLADTIRQARQDQLNANNDADKLAADERMNQLAVQAAAQTQGAATWLPKFVRALWVTPFILYTWKLVVWDKMLGYGATDSLGPDLGKMLLIMVTFYFLDSTISRITGR